MRKLYDFISFNIVRISEDQVEIFSFYGQPNRNYNEALRLFNYAFQIIFFQADQCLLIT